MATAKIIITRQSQLVKAMAIMVMAMLVAPVMDAIAKSLATWHDVSPATVSFGRFFMQAVFLSGFVFVAWWRRHLPVCFSPINILRGMIMGCAALLFFTAVKYMPLADAIAVFFVEPLIVMLLSSVFLRETVGWRRRVAAVVGFAGALIVIRPSYELFGLISLLPLAAAFLFSLYLILTRRAGSDDDPLIMQFYAGIGGVIVCSLGLLIGEIMGFEDLRLSLPQTPQAWSLLAGIGLFAIASHMMIVFAFVMAPASVLAPFQYVEIVAATGLGLLLFGDFPEPLQWLGIAIIVGSGIYIFLRERALERSEMQPGTIVASRVSTAP